MQGVRRSIAVLACVPVAWALAPSATAQAPTPTRSAPIYVESAPIKRSTLRHWRRAVAVTVSDESGRQVPAHRIAATQFLIEQRWIEGEARDMGITVARKDVKAAFRSIRDRQFPRRRDFRRYLRRTRLTAADLRTSARVAVLGQRIAARVVEGAADVHDAQARMVAYREQRKAKWQPRTICAPAWTVDEWCAQ